MYRHFLLPSDGSPASLAAIKESMRFAKACEARVTGLYVIPDFHLFTASPHMLGATPETYQQDSHVHARQVLAAIDKEANLLGVACETVSCVSDQPFEAIIATARQHHCDLITMASHGYRGMKGMLLGSETHKVLTHSTIPVLVYRST